MLVNEMEGLASSRPKISADEPTLLKRMVKARPSLHMIYRTLTISKAAFARKNSELHTNTHLLIKTKDCSDETLYSTFLAKWELQISWLELSVSLKSFSYMPLKSCQR